MSVETLMAKALIEIGDVASKLIRETDGSAEQVLAIAVALSQRAHAIYEGMGGEEFAAAQYRAMAARSEEAAKA